MATRIHSGLYAAGSKLPSEAELAEEFDNIHRMTARGVLERLADLGLVYPVHGSGWYVRKNHRVEFPLMTIDRGRATATKDVWRTFLDSISRAGGADRGEVTVGPPPQRVAELLDLGLGELCAIRPRIRKVDGDPWMRSTGYFPMSIAEGTDLARDADMQSPSPLALLIQMGHAPVRTVDRIGSRMPLPDEATLFGIERGIPLLTNYRVSWDREGRAVRCTVDEIAAHRIELLVEQEH